MTLSHPLRFLPAALLAASLGARAQTPTPTPTPTATPTPTTTLAAGSSLYTFPASRFYDGANIVHDADGAIWSVSSTDTKIAKVHPDRSVVTRWTLAPDTSPSSLLRDDDGTFWITELGGFKIGHFNPADGSLTEWPDAIRRPTSLVKRPDGKFWLPETGGYLALFDPAVPSFTYYQTPFAYYYSYPWADADGSLWACDFIYHAIVRWAPDMSKARVWSLSADVAGPSKIVRLYGKIWISFFYSGQIGRFDEETGDLDLFSTGEASNPFDLHAYRGRILYSDEAGRIGFLDPTAAASTKTKLTPLDTTPFIASAYLTQGLVSTLSPVDEAVTVNNLGTVTGVQSAGGGTVTPANGSTIWGLSIDEKRARIYFGTVQGNGALSAPPFVQADELYLTVASSGSTAAGTSTQVVSWNRGTPDAAGATKTSNLLERLLPDGWIAGWAPVVQQAVEAGKMLVQADAVGTDMKAPGALGSMRVVSDRGADTFLWSRVAAPAEGGGTLGAAANAVLGTAAIAAADSGFLFAPADASLRTHAGVLVVHDATGTVSIVDAAGKTRVTFPFDWPSGYRVEAAIFDAFGLPALPSARIVCTVRKGSVLLFGTAYDPVSGDAVRLDLFRSSDVGLWPVLPGFVRGNGAAGTLQLFNPGTASAHVNVSFRPAVADGSPALPGQPIGSVTVPAGGVVSVDLGAGAAAQGVLDLSSDQAVSSFATYRRATPGGGTAGYGVAAQQIGASIGAGSRGVFLCATANDAFTSTLQLVNSGFDPATVTVKFTGADGTAAGSETVSLAPQAVVNLPAWPAGQTTDMGRVDVTPGDGSAPVLALLARRDRVSQDTDAVLPFVITR